MKNAQTSVFRMVMVYALCGSLSLQPILLNAQVGGTDPLSGLSTDSGGFATSVPQGGNVGGVFQLPFNNFSSDLLPLNTLSQSFFRLHTIAGQGLGQADSSTSFGAFLPIGQNNDRFIVDGQLRLISGGTTGGNVGAGWRHYFEDQNRILGSWFWYDHDRSHTIDHEQIGLSFESLGKFLDGRANFYYPLDDGLFDPGRNAFGEKTFQGNDLIDDFTRRGEVAMKGFDWELGGPAPVIGKYGVRGYAGMYHYQGAGLHAYGTQARIEGYIPKINLSYNVKMTNDSVFDTNVTLGATWYFGRSRRQSHGWRNPNTTIRAQSADFEEERSFTQLPMYWRMQTEPVERNINITVGAPEIVDFDILFNADLPGMMTPFHIIHIDSNAPGGGDGTFESPFNTLAGAADPTVGAIYYVHSGSMLTGDDQMLTLSEQQRLLGEDRTGMIFSHNVRITDLAADPDGDGIVALPLSGSDVDGIPEITNTMNDDLMDGVNIITSAGSNLEVSGLIFNGSNATMPVSSAVNSSVMLTDVAGFFSQHVTINGGEHGFDIHNPSTGITALINATNSTPGLVQYTDVPTLTAPNAGGYQFDTLTLNDQIGEINADPTIATASAFEVTNDVVNAAATFDFDGITLITDAGDAILGRRGDAVNFDYRTLGGLSNATSVEFEDLQIEITDNGAGLIADGIGSVAVTTGTIDANRGQAVDIDGTGVTAAALNPSTGTAIDITLTNLTSTDSPTTGVRLIQTDASGAGGTTGMGQFNSSMLNDIIDPAGHGIQIENARGATAAVGGAGTYTFGSTMANMAGIRTRVTQSGTAGIGGQKGDAYRFINNTGTMINLNLATANISNIENGGGLIAIDTSVDGTSLPDGAMQGFTLNMNRLSNTGFPTVVAMGGPAVNIDGVIGNINPDTPGVFDPDAGWTFNLLRSFDSDDNDDITPLAGDGPTLMNMDVGIRFADTIQDVTVLTADVQRASDFGLHLQNNADDDAGDAGSVAERVVTIGRELAPVMGVVPFTADIIQVGMAAGGDSLAAIQVEGRNVAGVRSGAADIVYNGTVNNTAGESVVVMDKPLMGTAPNDDLVTVTFNGTIVDRANGDGIVIDNNLSEVTFTHPSLNNAIVTDDVLSVSLRPTGATSSGIRILGDTDSIINFNNVEVVGIPTMDAFFMDDQIVFRSPMISAVGDATPTVNFDGVIDQAGFLNQLNNPGAPLNGGTTGFAINIESIDGGTVNFLHTPGRMLPDQTGMMNPPVIQPTFIAAVGNSDGIRLNLVNADSVVETGMDGDFINFNTQVFLGFAGSVDNTDPMNPIVNPPVRINGDADMMGASRGFALTIITDDATQDVTFSDAVGDQGDLELVTGDQAGGPGMGGISHTGPGTLHIPGENEVAIIDSIGAGAAGLAFDTTNMEDVVFDSISVQSIGSTTDAVSFNDTTGTFEVLGMTNLGSAMMPVTGVGRGIDIEGGTADYTFTGAVTISDRNNHGIRYTMVTDGSLTFDNTVDINALLSGSAAGLEVSDTSGAATSTTFNSTLTIADSGGDAILIDNNTTTTDPVPATTGIIFNGITQLGTAGGMTPSIAGRGIAIVGNNDVNVDFATNNNVLEDTTGHAIEIEGYDGQRSGTINWTGDLTNTSNRAIFIHNTMSSSADDGTVNIFGRLPGSIDDMGDGIQIGTAGGPANDMDINIGNFQLNGTGGIDIIGGDAGSSYDFNGGTVGTTTDGVRIDDSDATVTFTDVNIENPQLGPAFSVNEGLGVVTYTGGSIAQDQAQRLIEITSREDMAADITFSSTTTITADDASTGINIVGSAGTNRVFFDGRVNIGGTTALTGDTAVNIDFNGATGAEVEFDDLDINVANDQSGLVASNGGILDIQADYNNVGTATSNITTTGAGVAVNLLNLTDSQVVLNTVTATGGPTSAILLEDLQSTNPFAFQTHGTVAVDASLAGNPAIQIDGNLFNNLDGTGNYLFEGAVNITNRAGTGINILDTNGVDPTDSGAVTFSGPVLVTGDGDGDAINITNTMSDVTFSGSVNVQDGNIVGADGIVIAGNSAAVAFTGTTNVTADTSNGIDISSNTGTVTFATANVALTAATGEGIRVNNPAADITFTTANVNSSGGDGIHIAGTTWGGMTRFNGGTLTHSSATSSAFRVDNINGSLDVQYNGNMNVSAGNSIEIQNTVAGSDVKVAQTLGNDITETGTGLGYLINNVGGIVDIGSAANTTRADLTGTGGITITDALATSMITINNTRLDLTGGIIISNDAALADINFNNVDVRRVTAGMVAVNITDGAGDIDFALDSDIEDTNTGAILNITNRSGGTIDFDATSEIAATNDSGGMIIRDATTSNTITFEGAVNLGQTIANVTSRLDQSTALEIDNINGGVTQTINFNGGLDVYTNTEIGIDANVIAGEVVLNIVDTAGMNNIIDTTGGGAQALILDNIMTDTGIGFDRINVQNIGNATDAIEIINLDNTLAGTGDFMVTAVELATTLGVVRNGIIIDGGDADQTWTSVEIDDRINVGIDVSNREDGSTLTFAEVDLLNGQNRLTPDISLTNNDTNDSGFGTGGIFFTDAGGTGANSLSNVRGTGIEITHNNATSDALYSFDGFTITRPAGAAGTGLEITNTAIADGELRVTMTDTVFDFTNIAGSTAISADELSAGGGGGSINFIGSTDGTITTLNDTTGDILYDYVTGTGNVTGSLQINAQDVTPPTADIVAP